MSLAEKAIKEHATKDPKRYGQRVRWQALIYFVLNIISMAIIVVIALRVQYFVTLAQRSNVETLTIAIIFILALYYLLTTFGGFIGSLRIAWLNSPLHKPEARERRKHRALPMGGSSKYVCFDRAICLRGKPDQPIVWQVADDEGKLGELVVDGVQATYYPIKDGMNTGIFEFLDDQIEAAMRKRDKEASLSITQWSTIDEDQASAYACMVKAFENLAKAVGTEAEVWPRYELTQEDIEQIGLEIRKLVPILRSESLLPKLEYEVEYNVPVLPEPLGFLRLTRRDNRADPLITMGCAGLVMLGVMALLTLLILLPPWIPAR